MHLRRPHSYFPNYDLQILLLDPKDENTPEYPKGVGDQAVEKPTETSPPSPEKWIEAPPLPNIDTKPASPPSRPRRSKPEHTPPPAARAVDETRAKMDRMRLCISERLKEAKNTVTSLTTFNEIDISSLVDMRQRPNPEGAQHQARPHARVCSCVHIRAPGSPSGEHEHRGRLDRLSRLCPF